MAWIIGGAAVLGSLIASDSASDASDAASQSEANQLAFAQQQYDDWKAIYGPLQQNLADFYGSLTPDYYEVQGLQAFEKEKASAVKKLNESLAQRGISDSGISAALNTQLELGSAQTRAQIRTDAPRKAAEDQLKFLQVGLGQDPSGDVLNTLSQQAQTNRLLANQSQQAAGEATQNAITTVGTALSDYYNDGKI